MRAEMRRSTSAPRFGMSSSSPTRRKRMCACGNPRLWNSTTEMTYLHFHGKPSFVLKKVPSWRSRSNSCCFNLNTRHTMSGRSVQLCPGSSASWISFHMGLQVIVRKHVDLPCAPVIASVSSVSAWLYLQKWAKAGLRREKVWEGGGIGVKLHRCKAQGTCAQRRPTHAFEPTTLAGMRMRSPPRTPPSPARWSSRRTRTGSPSARLSRF